MDHTRLYRAGPGAQPTKALSDHVTKELHRYDAHMRDVRGLAAGTRKQRIHIVGLLLVYSTPSGQRFHAQLDTHSTANWTLIPR